MDAPRIRSRILVVALILFVAGSALAWNRGYRRATSPEAPRPADDCYMAIDHGGRIVPDAVDRVARHRPAPSPTRARPTPAPVVDQPGPTPAPTVRKVEVQNGDNLHRVAERALGDSSRWREIANLNDLRSPYVIQPGQTLTVPSR